MDIKTLLKQHILTILCAVAILALFLPFFSVTSEMEMQYANVSSSSTATTTGFGAVTKTLLGWALVIGPILLVAMNYVKKLEKYKGLLAIAVPVVCLVFEIITFFTAKGSSVSASGGNGAVGMEIKATLGIGFFVLILVYLGMIVAGAVLYHNFTLDKAGLERLKAEGADMFSGGIGKLKESGTNLVHSASDKISNMQSNRNSDSSNEEAPKPQKKSIKHNKVEETLSLIEKLASMKENGVLTEEEFTAKKKELLEGI